MDSGIWLQYVGCFIPGIDGTVEIIMAKIRNKSYSLKGETPVATQFFMCESENRLCIIAHFSIPFVKQTLYYNTFNILFV